MKKRKIKRRKETKLDLHVIELSDMGCRHTTTIFLFWFFNACVYLCACVYMYAFWESSNYPHTKNFRPSCAYSFPYVQSNSRSQSNSDRLPANNPHQGSTCVLHLHIHHPWLSLPAWLSHIKFHFTNCQFKGLISHSLLSWSYITRTWRSIGRVAKCSCWSLQCMSLSCPYLKSFFFSYSGVNVLSKRRKQYINFV